MPDKISNEERKLIQEYLSENEVTVCAPGKMTMPLDKPLTPRELANLTWRRRSARRLSTPRDGACEPAKKPEGGAEPVRPVAQSPALKTGPRLRRRSPDSIAIDRDIWRIRQQGKTFREIGIELKMSREAVIQRWRGIQAFGIEEEEK